MPGRVVATAELSIGRACALGGLAILFQFLPRPG